MECRQEIVAEIADHLSEISEAHQAVGLSDEEACERALEQVSDWRQFCRDVENSKEDSMLKSLHKVFIPGVVAYAISGLVFRFLYSRGLGVTVLRFGDQGWFYFNWIWLVCVVPCGGVAALLSRRAGGCARQRLTAALFPVAGIAAFLILTCLTTIAVRAIFNADTAPVVYVLQALAGYLISFVAIPGTAMLIGALPFLGGHADRGGEQPFGSTTVSD
jgi:hypothetical protein